jgi:hypothetical protein
MPISLHVYSPKLNSVWYQMDLFAPYVGHVSVSELDQDCVPEAWNEPAAPEWDTPISMEEDWPWL